MKEQVVTTTIGIADDVKANGKSALVAGASGVAGGTAVVACYEAVPEMSAKILVYGAPLIAGYMTAKSVFGWHKRRKKDANNQAIQQLQEQYNKLLDLINTTAKEKLNNG